MKDSDKIMVASLLFVVFMIFLFAIVYSEQNKTIRSLINNTKCHCEYCIGEEE
jgi:hypothetical protein